MRHHVLRFSYIAVLWSLYGAAADAYIAPDRWSRTATNPSTGSKGTPVTITWGFAPDGTNIPGNPSGTIDSGLIAFLDMEIGAGPGGTDFTLRPWFPIFDLSFERISALSGVTYVYEPNDDGVTFADNTGARGVLGLRGDVRIGGKSYGLPSNTLASNFGPDYSEMMINTDKGSFFSNSNDLYRGFRNTLMHEAMHGLGISHVDSTGSSFLIEPILSTAFDGPQLDDLLAIQRLYGDVREKNGGNDTFGQATSLGQLGLAQSISLGALGNSTVIGAAQVDFLSIDDDSDTDFFSFSLDSRLDVNLQLNPRGTTYQVGPQDGAQSAFNALSLSNLSLALFDTNGTSLLGTADSNPAGAGESILRSLLPGTYYARVKGAQDQIQIYGLNLTAAAPVPRNLFWVGNQSPNWNVATTANFAASTGPTVYFELDHVTFTDAAAVQAVNLPDDIAAGNLRVTTTEGYVFSGPGGIVAGSLTVDGPGLVELANSGNSYSGATRVESGTLKITGDANAMTSAIEISGGATLVMDASDAATMGSDFTIHSNAVLQIGEMESDSNVFPDLPDSIQNDGTIRVLDEESLQSVSGAGQIVVEQETTSLSSNSLFNGEIIVQSGAVARVEDGAGLGSPSGTTVIEAGGSLVVDTDAELADPLSLAGDGLGNGALLIATGRSANLMGQITLATSSAAIHVAENAMGTFNGAADGMLNSTSLTLDVAAGGSLVLQGELALAAGGVIKHNIGAAELAGAISYNGATVVNEGVLRLTGSGLLAGEFQVDQGATLELDGAHQFADSARLIGNGLVVGDLVMPGAIAPGASAGTLTLADDLTLSDTSRLEIEIGGTTAGTGFDVLSIAGLANLDGLFDISLIDDFLPAVDDAFEVVHADGGIFGQFDSIALPMIAPEFAWTVLYSSSSVLLQIVAANIGDLPGDFNEDGVVDAADYIVWRRDDGSPEGYDTWRANFGQTAGGGANVNSSSSAGVPEPTGLVLALTGSIIAIVVCRRQ